MATQGPQAQGTPKEEESKNFGSMSAYVKAYQDRKAVTKQIRSLLADPPPGIFVVPHEDDYHYADAMIEGPDRSPFEGGKFRLELFFPEDYPFKPPKVQFVTKIYHPNIDRLGRICLDSLMDDDWSPVLTIEGMLLTIQSLLGSLDSDSLPATDVARHYKENKADAQRVSREWTIKYAV